MVSTIIHDWFRKCVSFCADESAIANRIAAGPVRDTGSQVRLFGFYCSTMAEIIALKNHVLLSLKSYITLDGKSFKRSSISFLVLLVMFIAIYFAFE